MSGWGRKTQTQRKKKPVISKAEVPKVPPPPF